MRARALGRTGLMLTELGFGAASLGNLYRAIADETAAATVEAAWNGGIRYFDTAPHYGLGLSERRLGAALGRHPREQFVVSTKVGRLLEENAHPRGSDLDTGFDVPDDLHRVSDYSRDGVLRSIEDSLRRLDLDRVDIVYVHDPDDHLQQALDDAVPALVELREQGVIRAVGVGMNHVPPLLRFVRETDIDVVMVAGRWTLADRRAAELLHDCEQRGVGAIAAAPFNSGLLAGPDPAGAHFDYSPPQAEAVAFAERAAAICAAQGVALAQAALQFALRTPAVVSVVAGMAGPIEAEQNTRLFGGAVPVVVWEALAELAPLFR